MDSGQLRLLQNNRQRLEELDPAQPVAEQVLHAGPAHQGRPGQGLLLDHRQQLPGGRPPQPRQDKAEDRAHRRDAQLPQPRRLAPHRRLLQRLAPQQPQPVLLLALPARTSNPAAPLPQSRLCSTLLCFQTNSNSCSSLDQPPVQQRLPHRSQQQASFVDTSPYFSDLNASFKRLYKSIIDNKDVYQSEFNSKFQTPPSDFQPMTSNAKAQHPGKHFAFTPSLVLSRRLILFWL